MADQRIVIVGAGPAGCRAAERLAASGLRPTVIDEAPAAGGQIYRRPPAGFGRTAETLYGSEAGKAKKLHAAFDGLADRVDYRPGTSVWGLAGNRLFLRRGGCAEVLSFDRLILATGATDRVMPVPGWTRPGVYTLGAAQIALKAQGVAIGSPVVFLGSGPLLLLVAYQYASAGAAVAAVLDTSRLRDQVTALPRLAARPRLLARGIALRRGLRRMGVCLHQGVRPDEILGDETGVTGVRWRDAGGISHRTEASAVGLGWHLRSETQLAQLAGCDLAFDPVWRQWSPVVDAMGRSGRPDVYLAGDGTRILGADGAEVAGRLAALALLQDAGLPASPTEVHNLLRLRKRLDRFSRGVSRAFPWPAKACAALPDEAILCRCEAVTAGAYRQTLKRSGAGELNRAKAQSRVGMGRCQGRYCGAAAAEIVAQAGGDVADAGWLRPQAPVKPLPANASIPEL
ncbi:NAD(P)/FAD-dependent oxidoreductase [Aurantimonas sp. VKM B-3413]|uniref:FAD/NAD(P)-dependent oxidoreductase n=1 Tax=Aurantimonas sp. VKM B-3413 TaxID=2779401 RepID=UPI001E491AAA|nr:FAD/NAD(P)-binding oxidoreductase [Aurantimonas sp. VKM B-3413]MCB8840340.1 NAD(P)/FAD-dependent oxidoreductase [Aurantimonas sp. VKM B-3413]